MLVVLRACCKAWKGELDVTMERKEHTERREGEMEGERKEVCAYHSTYRVSVISSSCDKRIFSYDRDGRWSTAANH